MYKIALLLALLSTSATASPDSDLNETYQQVLKKNPDISQYIKQSQRDWLKFSKSDCIATTLKTGSRGVGIEWHVDACISELKIERTQYLKENYLY